MYFQVYQDMTYLTVSSSTHQPFLPIQGNCYLFVYLMMYFGYLYCKHYGPRSDSGFKVFPSMIKTVLSVFNTKHQNIFWANNIGIRIRVKIILLNVI